MNQEIKLKIRQAGTTQWRVAEALGVSEGTLLRWLRHKLTEERKAAILAAIEKVKGGIMK